MATVVPRVGTVCTPAFESCITLRLTSDAAARSFVLLRGEEMSGHASE